MVFTTATVRVSRFSQDQQLPFLGPIGPELGGIDPGFAIGGGLPGPFGPSPLLPPPLPPGAGVSPTANIVRVSVPRPVNPGMQINMIMWFAAAFGPAQYAMRVEIPSVGYSHDTPYISGGGPSVLMLQNSFRLPVDAAPGDLQGQITLLRVDPQTNQIMTDDSEPFTLKVELTPTQPDGCPTGAHKDNTGVCVCTDPTMEIVGSSCVAKCPSGQHRDSTGNCVPDAVPCATGEHKDDNGNCVPDVTPCPAGQHRDSNGSCVPDDVTCPSGQHKNDSGVCVPDDTGGGTTPPPPPPTNCFTFQNIQYCESTTGGQGCVRIAGKWYCPPGSGSGDTHHGGGRHHRMCFRKNGIRYCKVTTPPADTTGCITVGGNVWCPRPYTGTGGGQGMGHCPTGQHFSHCTCNCVPDGQPEPQCIRDCTQCATGQRFDWSTHTCVPDTGGDHDHGDDEDNDNSTGPPDYTHGNNITQVNTPGGNIISAGNGGTGVTVSGSGVGGSGTGIATSSSNSAGVNVQNIISNTENYINSVRNTLYQQHGNPQQIESYANNLRNSIYSNVQKQLQAAGINFHF